MWLGDGKWADSPWGDAGCGAWAPPPVSRPPPCPGAPLPLTLRPRPHSARAPARSPRAAPLPPLTHPCCRGEPRCPPAPGRGPLIRHMNKSQRLLKRRAVVSAVIKCRVSAEEGAIKSVWEEGRVREGAAEGLTLQLGPEGRHAMGCGAASSKASCPAHRADCVLGAPGLGGRGPERRARERGARGMGRCGAPAPNSASARHAGLNSQRNVLEAPLSQQPLQPCASGATPSSSTFPRARASGCTLS